MSRVCPSWLSFMLYNPLRTGCTDREKILDESRITPDSVVLEIGSGNGFLTEMIAGRSREVLAVELQPGMVRKLKKRVQKFGDKVKIITGDIAGTDICEACADVCLLYFSFHEIKDKAGAVRNISKAVKSGGILAIYEPKGEVRKTGMKEAVQLFEAAGFQKEAEHSTLFTRIARLNKRRASSVPSE